MKINNRNAIILSAVFIMISVILWVSYLFFYDPSVGALLLLWTIPFSLMGIVVSFYITKIRLKITLIVVHLFLVFSFIYPFLLWLILTSLAEAR